MLIAVIPSLPLTQPHDITFYKTKYHMQVRIQSFNVLKVITRSPQNCLKQFIPIQHLLNTKCLPLMTNMTVWMTSFGQLRLFIQKFQPSTCHTRRLTHKCVHRYDRVEMPAHEKKSSSAFRD